MPQNDAQCGSVDCVVSLLACHRFWPQALAEALKVNTTLTNIDLRGNDIGMEGAEAWARQGGPLGRGRVIWFVFEMGNSSGVGLVDRHYFVGFLKGCKRIRKLC